MIVMWHKERKKIIQLTIYPLIKVITIWDMNIQIIKAVNEKLK